MIIAGEASGDLHGAKLVKTMVALEPDLEFFGIGGKALREAGVDVHVDNSEIAVVGFSELFPKINVLLNALRQAKRDLKTIRPSLLILIDFPEFNLHMATVAKKLGIPVLYYISPQIWAWRTYRVRKIKRVVDHMVVIFPFEVDFYKRRNVPVTFVGHPLLDHMQPGEVGGKGKDVREDGILVGLLPGSRNQEIARHLPVMVKVAEILSEQIHPVRFAIPVASSVRKEDVEALAGRGKVRISVLADGLQQVLEEATLIITASGTVTLEAAIAATPMIIVYKMAPLSYWLARLLVRVPHIGLANLVAGRPIVPELVQQAASAEEIASRALTMIEDPEGLEKMRFELRRVAKKLGKPGASRRVADIALGLIRRDGS
jgi:lipid-A-disaccharide synthase